MPRGDRTGPLGEGPMSGRQLGYGAGYNTPGYTKARGAGLGRRFFNRFGFGLGYRGGFRNRGNIYPTDREYVQRFNNTAHYEKEFEEEQINSLKSEVQDLRDNLKQIMERLETISSNKDTK